MLFRSDAGADEGLVSLELSDVLVSEVGDVVGPEDVDVAVKVYVMQEHAELTAVISPAQLPKSVGMAEGAVVVPERNSGQKDFASSAKRSSINSL